MNRVGVIVVKDKNIVIAATGDGRNFTSLIGIIFEDILGWNQHGADVVSAGFYRRR